MLGVRRAQSQGREVACGRPANGNIKATKSRLPLAEARPEIRHRFLEARLGSTIFNELCEKAIQHILSRPLLRLVCE